MVRDSLVMSHQHVIIIMMIIIIMIIIIIIIIVMIIIKWFINKLSRHNEIQYVYKSRLLEITTQVLVRTGIQSLKTLTIM